MRRSRQMGSSYRWILQRRRRRERRRIGAPLVLKALEQSLTKTRLDLLVSYIQQLNNLDRVLHRIMYVTL